MRWSEIGLIFVVLSALAAGANQPAAQQGLEKEDPGLWQEVVRLYESAKEKGEQVPQDIYEWVRVDLRNQGSWEYRVVDVAATPPQLVEQRLNDLGAERWECIWIQPSGKMLRLFLKRPIKSYLRELSLPQLLRLLPSGGSDSGGD